MLLLPLLPLLQKRLDCYVEKMAVIETVGQTDLRVVEIGDKIGLGQTDKTIRGGPVGSG